MMDYPQNHVFRSFTGLTVKEFDSVNHKIKRNFPPQVVRVSNLEYHGKKDYLEQNHHYSYKMNRNMNHLRQYKKN